MSQDDAILNKLDTGVSVTVGTLTQPQSTTATHTNVAASTSSVQLLGANVDRQMATFYNDSASNMFMKFASAASNASFTVRLTPQAYYELPLPIHTGIIHGIWDTAVGTMRIMELNP